MANQLPKNTYTSCIRIGGVPILPPLMTPERRLDMERYKRKAMEVEKRIKTRAKHQPAVTIDKTLENSLAFDSIALIDECDTVPPRNVPLEETKTQLTCNIFDVTEYNDRGFTLFKERQRPDLQISTSAVIVEEGTNSTTPPRLSQSQPRLLRSNSYTLDAPSPVLLEHFKQHIKERDNSIISTLPVDDSPPSDNSSKFNSIDSIIPQSGLTIDQIGDLIEGLANVHFGNVRDSISTTVNSPSYTVGYSSGSPEILNTSSVQLIDFESDTGDNLTPCFDRDVFVDLLSGSVEKPTKNCARELFVDSPKQLRKEWAATVLTAAARGYLVRRLKRTERVKILIQTIGDTLMCAMSLHSEQTDRIQPSDVELHRRLIQQISAACYEFHDIFFKLSTSERMEIISLDRQRLKEKLKRPTSTSSSKLDSDRSSRSSQTHSFHTKQKKALVTSLVA
ncbi:hypothetical protein RI129_010787 [Pyrocoelia pectoralis]|uniref:Uncharacterized protein n=1 Tax=Pyrocoelia pectoralis TaxID=417401 RepID=A0AAN7V7L2_9COLE